MSAERMGMPLLSDKAKEFFAKAFTETGMDFNDIKFDQSNPEHLKAFSNIADLVTSHDPDAGDYFNKFADRFVKFQAGDESNTATYLEHQDRMFGEYERALNSMERLIEIATHEKPFLDYATDGQDVGFPEMDVQILTEAPADTPEPKASEPTPAIPAFLRAGAGKPRIQMTPEEAAAHDAENSKDKRPVLSANATKGHAPLPMAAVPSEAVPEGDAPAIGSAIAPEGQAPALGGVTRDDNGAQAEIEDAEFEDLKEPTLYDMPLEQFEGLEEMPDAEQDAFVKRAIAEWYERYFNAQDLDDVTVQIIAERFTLDRERDEVLAEINRDIEIKQFKANAMTEFDHKMIENHIALDPESIERTLAEKLPDRGIADTDGSKIRSWVFPGLQAAVAGGIASSAAKMTLDVATGGVAGAVAGAIGGAAGAYASEQYKLNLRVKELVERKPELANLNKSELKQHAIKEDKVATLQDRLQKVEDQIEAAKERQEGFRVKLEKHYGGNDGAKDDLNKTAKRAARAQKKVVFLENNRNELIKQLEHTKAQEPSSFSLRKHLMSRVMMGAVMGTVAGSVLALEPVQAAMSDAFNAVSGAAVSVLEFVKDFATPDAGVTGADLLGPELAALGGGGDSVVAPEPVDQGDPVNPFDAELAAALGGAEDSTLVAPEAEAATVAPEVAGPPAMDISAEVSNLISTFDATGIQPLGVGDVGAALETHFDGDVPASYEPYVDNLASDDPAIRAEAMHSIAYLLAGDNASLRLDGHRELASAIMAGNVMQFGLDSADPAVIRSVEGLSYFQPEVMEALRATDGQNLSQVASLIQQSAAGEITLNVAGEATGPVADGGTTPRFTPI